jgi:arginyl-tRNA synthetase
MNIFALFAGAVAEAAAALKSDGGFPADFVLPALSVEPVKDRAHGDLASNAAMILAKPAGMKPRDLAEALAARLAKHPDITKVDVAGPGFINMTLSPAVWQRVAGAVLVEGSNFGKSKLGKGERVNVEYVSANPTGPMHVGHCRGAVFGDALASLLAFAGYDVTREYYINDAGGQVDMLARSVFLRYREALGEDIGAIPDGLYPGDYLKPVGEALAKERAQSLLNMPAERWLPIVRTFAIEAMMPIIKADLAALNIQHDVFFSEASLSQGGTDKVKAAIEDLRQKGYIYEGRLPKPQGHDSDEWEDREQTLFKSTDFGDDVDRALLKSDGSYTYFAGDVAYHYDKLGRGYRHLVNVFGADHMGYIHRMLATVAAFTGGSVPLKSKGKLKDWRTAGGTADLDIRVVNLVKLFKNGEPFKMSKRAGTFVTLRDVVDEVGPDAVRFMMLYRKELEPLDFDFQKVTEQSRENPVFYVQYGHARCCSVFRKVEDAFPGLAPASAEVTGAKLSRLDHPGEIDLMRRLAEFPRIVEGAALAHEPHRIAFYLYELASDLHGLWNQGKDLPQLRFIREDDRELTAARVALISATANVLATGLSMLGVRAPEEMR